MTFTNTTSGEVSTFTYDPAKCLTSVDGVGYTWDDGDRWAAWQPADAGVRNYIYETRDWTSVEKVLE